jgi:Xaa-Pro aminopeptidase
MTPVETIPEAEMTPEEIRARRFASLRVEMRNASINLVALAPSDSLRYLLGFSPKADERACMLLVTQTRSVMLMPNLNAEQASAQTPELELLRWSDDANPADALTLCLAGIGASTAVLAAADPEMRADHLLLLQAALPGARLTSAASLLATLRESKEPAELALLQRSADVADAAMFAAFAAMRPGVTELEIADVVAQRFAAGGSTVEFSIIGGGPNGAFPHHHTGPRPLREGDAVVIDIGGRLGGYVSDITRMAFIGEPTDRYREIHAIVETAVQAAMAASKPGTTCASVDAAARNVIEAAGYGDYFVSRTGHGLGLSVHESPWIVAGNETELRPGVVHSIEPGIYLPGEFGLRLEDIVHVTDSGCERFSSLSRGVHVVA